MTARAKSMTFAEHVRRSLRADILAGRLSPGQPLRLEPLMAQFDVSRSVIREALIGLTEENIVVSRPNQGFRVVDVSADDLRDLISLRVPLESRALTLSIELGDTAWEAAVLSAHHFLERASQDNPAEWAHTEEWVAAHDAFHAALLAACGSPRLIALTNSLRHEASIYQQVRTAGEAEPDTRDVGAEHRKLMQFAIDRDAKGAIEVLEHEMHTTTDIVLRALERAGGD